MFLFFFYVFMCIYISSKCLCVSACTESNEYFLQSWSQDGRLTRGTRKPARCCLNLAAALAWWLHWSETSVCGSDWCILGRTSCCDWWTEKVICWLNCYIMADCYPFFCCARKKKKTTPKPPTVRHHVLDVKWFSWNVMMTVMRKFYKWPTCNMKTIKEAIGE